MITLEQVLKAYEYADSHPHEYFRGTTNWCAAVAHSLNEHKPAAQHQGDSTAWVGCSPAWLKAGGDCATAPRICVGREGISHLHPAHSNAEQPASVAVVMPERDAIRDLIAEAIGGDTYDCTRVWSAWGVGTMSEDDFVPVAEQDERLYEIADSFLAEIARLNGVKP